MLASHARACSSEKIGAPRGTLAVVLSVVAGLGAVVPCARADVRVTAELRQRFPEVEPDGESKQALHILLDQSRDNNVSVNSTPGANPAASGEILVTDRQARRIDNRAPHTCLRTRKQGRRRSQSDGVRFDQLSCKRKAVDLPYIEGSDYQDVITLVDPRARVFSSIRDPDAVEATLKFVGPSWIDGKGGVDRIAGGSGIDVITGGAGDDQIMADYGADIVYGWLPERYAPFTPAPSEDSDAIVGWRGGDSLYGGPDQDFIFGGGETDRIDGNRGSDLIVGGSGRDSIDGGPEESDWIFTKENREVNTFTGFVLDLEPERDVVRCAGGWSNQVQYDSIDALEGCPNAQDAVSAPASYQPDAPIWSGLSAWPGSPREDYNAILYGPDVP